MLIDSFTICCRTREFDGIDLDSDLIHDYTAALNDGGGIANQRPANGEQVNHSLYFAPSIFW